MPATGDRHRMVADAPRRQQKTMEPALKRCKPNEQEELIDKIAEQPVLPQEMALEDANILTMPAEDDELPSEPPQPKDEDDGHHHHHAAPATNTVAKPPTPECRDEHGTTYYGMEQGKRWRTHQMAEDYVQLAGNLMYPGTKLGSFGYDPALRQYPMERWTSVGYLTSPLRTPTILEVWSPRDIALFEAGMMQYGKHFHRIQRHLFTGGNSNSGSSKKSTKDIIAFYYIWKKTSHYRQWKKEYVPDDDLEAWMQEFNRKKEKR